MKQAYIKPIINNIEAIELQNMICLSIGIGEETYSGNDSGIGVKEEDFTDEELFNSVSDFDFE